METKYVTQLTGKCPCWIKCYSTNL